MQLAWVQLMDALPEDSGDTRPLFADILEQYLEKGRYYHNLDHIYLMLRRKKDFAGCAFHPEVLDFAIWYHDFFYHPLKKDNENRSAAHAQEVMRQLACPDAWIEQVTRMIRCSADHMQRDPNEPLTQQIFLDLDLLILGAPREQYESYAVNIRKEYRMVPALLYRTGRKKVLKRMLDAPSIFRTERYQTAYEQTARDNLRWEWDRLSRKRKNTA